MQTTFKDIVLLSTKICQCRLSKGMNGDEVLKVICETLDCLESQLKLDKVQYAKLGINTGKFKCCESLLTAIINALIAADESIKEILVIIRKDVKRIFELIANVADEKVKVTKDDPLGGYLADKITTPHAGSISFLNNQVTFYGLLPLGAVVIIDKSRIGDFDSDGKGKAGTDVYGYAISDGRNGTRNRLNRFPYFTDSLANAGNTDGENEISIALANISSFNIPVTGTIADALVSDIQLKIKFNTNKMHDGAGGQTQLLRLGTGTDGSNEMKTVAHSFKHSHTFTLTAKHDNAEPTKVPIIPRRIKEIPIQRIPV